MSTLNKLPSLKAPKVSIIILSYNSKQYVLKCLHSVQSSVFTDYEIILVDNASSDGTVAEVMTVFPAVQIVESEKNLGRTGGYNLGIKNSRGSLILFLDQDTEISSNMLGELVAVMDSDKSIGGCGPKIYYFDDPERLWSLGSYVGMKTGRTHFIGIDMLDQKQFDSILDVQQYPTAFLARTNLVRAVGGYDPEIYMVYCDSDICLKILKTGYRIVMVPKGKMWHKIKPPSDLRSKLGMKNPLMAFLIGRNRIIFMKRYSSPSNFSLFLTVFLPIYMVYYSIACVAESKLKILYGFWKGTVIGLKYILSGKKPIEDVYAFINQINPKQQKK